MKTAKSRHPLPDGASQDAQRKLAEKLLAFKTVVLRDTLEHMDQGISMVDSELRVVAWNRRFVELLDFPESLFNEQTTFADVIRFNARRGEYGPGDVEEQVRQRVELARRFEPHVFERKRPDGAILEIRGNPLPGGGFVTTYTDVTARKRAEHLLRLEHSVTRGFAETANAADALKGAIRAICESAQWECGRYLWVDSTAGVLRFGEAWSVPNAEIERYIEESRGMVYPSGVGLVGTVWQSQQPLWVPDIVNDPRVARPGLARAMGMRAALVVPVTGGGNPIGVLILHSRQIREPDARLLETIRTIGGQIGQYVQRAHAEQAVRESEARFRSLTELSSDLYWETDAEHRIVQYTYGAKIAPLIQVRELLGRRRWEIPGVVIPDEEGWRAHRATLDAHLPFRDFETARSGSDGNVRYFSLSGEPMFDAGEAFTGYRGVGREITEQKTAEARLDRLAHYDTVTGLPNRVLIHDRMLQAMARADRGQTLLAVMLLDLDRFKEINDSLGHAAGDEVLKEVARRLQFCLRATDSVGRLGGDEFTVLLEDIHHVDEVSTAARKILNTFAEPVEVDGRELHLSASIGVTVYPFDEKDADALLKNADIAMYQAKQEGRNNFQFFAAEMGKRTERSADLRLRLHRALERGEFALHYQPQVGLAGGGIFGVEALLRWTDAELGPVSPGQFIPVAEEMGLIVPLGDWVLREACRQCKSWLDAGLGPLRVAVNLSPRQFRQKKLARQIGEILRATGLPAACLEIEITEGIVMRHAERAITTLTELNRLGVQIAIDDFGTGYSSLAYLQRFPVHVLKIDQSFVQAIRGGTDQAAIVNTVIQLTKLLGLKALAEGVETVEQREYLRAHDCDAFQGYLFCKPQSAERIGELLAAHRRENASALP